MQTMQSGIRLQFAECCTSAELMLQYKTVLPVPDLVQTGLDDCAWGKGLLLSALCTSICDGWTACSFLTA